jgi:hypothetical protein
MVGDWPGWFAALFCGAGLRLVMSRWFVALFCAGVSITRFACRPVYDTACRRGSHHSNASRAASAVSVSAQGAAIFSDSNGSARVRPRLIATTGLFCFCAHTQNR